LNLIDLSGKNLYLGYTKAGGCKTYRYLTIVKSYGCICVMKEVKENREKSWELLIKNDTACVPRLTDCIIIV